MNVCITASVGLLALTLIVLGCFGDTKVSPTSRPCTQTASSKPGEAGAYWKRYRDDLCGRVPMNLWDERVLNADDAAKMEADTTLCRSHPILLGPKDGDVAQFFHVPEKPNRYWVRLTAPPFSQKVEWIGPFELGAVYPKKPSSDK